MFLSFIQQSGKRGVAGSSTYAKNKIGHRTTKGTRPYFFRFITLFGIAKSKNSRCKRTFNHPVRLDDPPVFRKFQDGIAELVVGIALRDAEKGSGNVFPESKPTWHNKFERNACFCLGHGEPGVRF